MGRLICFMAKAAAVFGREIARAARFALPAAEISTTMAAIMANAT